MWRTIISTTEVDPTTGAGVPGTGGVTMMETFGCDVTGCPGTYGWITDAAFRKQRIVTGHDHFII